MVDKNIYTNCGTVGPTEKPDGEAQQRSPTEQRGWPAISNGRAGQTDTRTGVQRRVDGRPTKGDRCPTESRSGLMEGATGARWRARSRGVAQRRVLGMAQGGTI
jgi:hypothetical protein